MHDVSEMLQILTPSTFSPLVFLTYMCAFDQNEHCLHVNRENSKILMFELVKLPRSDIVFFSQRLKPGHKHHIWMYL